MDQALRAFLRVLLTAGYFMLLPAIPFLGVNFTGGFLEALALAGVFELSCWATVFAYGGTAVAFGIRPQQLPLALNVGVFLAQSTAFLALAAYFVPTILVVNGIVAALCGGIILLGISATVMTRGRGCGCKSEADEKPAKQGCDSCPKKGSCDAANCGACDKNKN